MSSVGPNSCGTGTNASGGSGIAWTNPGNITSSDNVYTTSALNLANPFGRSTQWLIASNFGFSIPGGSTIDGIVVEIERHAASSVGSPADGTIQISTDATVAGQIGDNKASATTWPTTDAYATYGSSSDTWNLASFLGRAISAADINSSGFSITINGSVTAGKGTNTLSVDHVRVTIYYTLGTLKQKVTAGFTNGAAAHSLQYASNITAGNLLVAWVAFETSGGTPTVTVSDDVNGAWTRPAGYSRGGTVRAGTFFYFANSAGGSRPTVTATASAVAYMTIALFEYTPPLATVTFDNSVTNAGTSTTPSTGSCPVSGTNDIVVAAFGQGTGNITSCTTPLPLIMETTQFNGSADESGCVADVLGVNSATTATFTINTSVAWVAMAISFKFSTPSSAIGNPYYTLLSWRG